MVAGLPRRLKDSDDEFAIQTFLVFAFDFDTDLLLSFSLENLMPKSANTKFKFLIKCQKSKPLFGLYT